MYDVVIIGAGSVGREAARLAVTGGQRCALAFLPGDEAVLQPEANPQITESLRQLVALGVDVVSELGQFIATDDGIMWQTATRELAATAFLLTAPQTLDSSLGSEPPKENNTWGLIGAVPEHLVLAQTLAKAGQTVHLLSRNARLLPGEDPEFSELLQAYLESLGVTLWRNCRNIDIQNGSRNPHHRIKFHHSTQVESIHVFALSHWRSPPLPWQILKHISVLDASGMAHQGLTVNGYLQTRHPQIFAVGGWLKGYTSRQLARQEAIYVIQRLQGQISTKLDYATLPWQISLTPPWSRVGNPNHPNVTRYYYGYEPWFGDDILRGTCKIATDANNRMLSAWWWGRSACPGIDVISLAIAQGMTMEQLSLLPLACDEISDVFRSLKTS